MIEQNHTKGIFLSIAGYSSWVIGDTFVKLAGETIPILEILFISFFIGSLFTLLIASKREGIEQLKTSRLGFHFIRSLLIMVATYGSVGGVIYLSLADFYTIIFTSPLLLTVLGGLILKERTGLGIWLSTLFGFMGVVIAVQFASGNSVPLSWLGIGLTSLSSLALAIAMITTRASKNENNYALSFWPQVVGTCTSLVFLFIFSNFVFDAYGIAYCILCGILGAIGARIRVCKKSGREKFCHNLSGPSAAVYLFSISHV